jgi:hypothetical protein
MSNDFVVSEHTFQGVSSMSMTSNLFRRSMTSIDRFRQSNHRTANKMQRTKASLRLDFDNLDGRVLLAGNVSAVLTNSLLPFPTSGTLLIKGDIASNNIEISPSPVSPLLLRVKGITTSVNTVAFTDYVLSSISSIDVTMLNKNCTVTMKDFKIPNNITVTSGAGSDTLTLSNVTANQIKVTTASVVPDVISMNNVIVAGSATIKTGSGADVVSFNGGRIGTLNIDTGAGAAADTVSVTNFASATPGVPGIGQLTINTNGGSDKIDVSSTSLTLLTIGAGDGDNTVNVLAPFIRSSTSITTGAGSDKITFTSPSAKSVAINSGDGNDTIKLNDSKLTSAIIAAGAGINTIEINNDTFSGDLTVTSGDGPDYWTPAPINPPGSILPSASFTMNNSSGIAAAKITLGKNFRFVTVGADAANAVSAKSLDLSVGNGANVVVINTVIDGAEKITVGDFQNYPTILFPPNSITINGSAGSLETNIGNNAGFVNIIKTVAGTEKISVGDNSLTNLSGSAKSLDASIGNNASLFMSAYSTTDGGIFIAAGNNVTVDLNTVTTTNGGVNVKAGNDASVILFDVTTNGDPLLDNGDVIIDVGDFAAVSLDSVTVNDGDLIITTLAFATVDLSSVNVIGSDILVSTGDFSTVIMETVNADGMVSVDVGFDSYVYMWVITAGTDVTVNAGDSAYVQLYSVNADGKVSVDVGSDSYVDMWDITAGTDLTVTAGNFAWLTLGGITAANGDVDVTVGDFAYYVSVYDTTALSLNISAGNGDTYFYLANVSVADGSGLNLNTGDGDNTIELINLLVLDGLHINCGSGINTVAVDTVIADFGTINSGSGDSNLFIDMNPGTSEGFDTEGFDGFI